MPQFSEPSASLKENDRVPFLKKTGRATADFLWNACRSLGRRFLPRPVKRYVGTYYRLNPAARALYLRLRADDALRLNRANGTSTAKSGPGRLSFLFVCYGNLMRSPMAEAMLKQALAKLGIDDVAVRSAGLHASPGREAHEWALAVSKELGMPLDQHRAQAVTPELVSNSEIIFAMDFENLAELQTLYPDAKHKVLLLSRYAPGKMRNREIPDPYFGDIETTRRCYALLAECIANLAREIETEVLK
jgi:protein-tyrosine-phosphatase